MSLSSPNAVIRNLTLKYETFTRQSAEVIALLRPVLAAEGTCSQAQESERTVRQAKQFWDAKAVHLGSLRASQAATARQLDGLIRLCVGACVLSGVLTPHFAADFEHADPVAAALQIAAYAKNVPRAGESLSAWLMDVRAAYLACEQSSRAGAAAFEQSSRDFTAALYQGTAVITRGRAALVALGIEVARRRARRRLGAGSLDVLVATDTEHRPVHVGAL